MKFTSWLVHSMSVTFPTHSCVGVIGFVVTIWDNHYPEIKLRSSCTRAEGNTSYWNPSQLSVPGTFPWQPVKPCMIYTNGHRLGWQSVHVYVSDHQLKPGANPVCHWNCRDLVLLNFSTNMSNVTTLYDSHLLIFCQKHLCVQSRHFVKGIYIGPYSF